MNYYLECWKKYVEFSGRARRKEYWMFVLFNFIAELLIGVVAGVIGAYSLVHLYHLAILLPSIAVGVRRLHDIDRSGWWLLIGLVPLVGGIVLLVFACLEGVRGPNRFGPDPKAGAEPAAA